MAFCLVVAQFDIFSIHHQHFGIDFVLSFATVFSVKERKLLSLFYYDIMRVRDVDDYDFGVYTRKQFLNFVN